jgi:hypothetical protein
MFIYHATHPVSSKRHQGGEMKFSLEKQNNQTIVDIYGWFLTTFHHMVEQFDCPLHIFCTSISVEEHCDDPR